MMSADPVLHAPISLSEKWLGRTLQLSTPAWLLLLAAAITWGWTLRDEGLLTAETGAGYLLGIVGGTMMLLLLTYSLRKRVKSLRRLLTVKFWFRFHMILGILGPLCIIYHSNFHLGSLNSSVAFFCMLLVSGSGLVGRYLYGSIHHGLYGEKIKLQEIRKDLSLIRDDINRLPLSETCLHRCNDIFVGIDTLIDANKKPETVLSSRQARKQARQLAGQLNTVFAEVGAAHLDVGDQLARYRGQLDTYLKVLNAVLKKIPRLDMSERLFSLWHVVHLPIFGLMLVTAVIHVIVVHMY